MNKGTKQKTYAMRKGQLFGPWGIGAILPCPDGSSVMIAGLDEFPQTGLDTIYDPRLAHYIGVNKLCSPPIDNQGPVPAFRFPLQMYCPLCGRVERVKATAVTPPRCNNEACNGYHKTRLVPERFIVVCPEGHIDDIPLLEWVHHGPVSNPDEHHLTRRTRGGSATLDDIEYWCSCGKHRSLKGITKPGELEACGYHCRGNRPWLGAHAQEPCLASIGDSRVVQRGGTNVWYADVASSIYIPDSHDMELLNAMSRNIDALKNFEALGQDAFELYLNSTFSSQFGQQYSIDEMLAAYRALIAEQNEEYVTEGSYREEEYRALCHPDWVHTEPEVFDGTCISIDDYSSEIMSEVVESVTLVTTLKETKALVGFMRLYPDHNDGLSFAKRRRSLSRNNKDWTLASQMTGEGIFLKLKADAISQWQSLESVDRRIGRMQQQLDMWNRQRLKNDNTETKDSPINPAYVLIHTLSHILMLTITKECGYPTASVRERIYCDRYIDENDCHDSMLGLLIYTASEDSAGSLGGLVRAGKPGRFEPIFERAIIGAQWCSSDPVCIESPGQGPGSCNLAACYSCALVPETSCEFGNRMLDRGMLVGTLQDKTVGIFADVLDLSGNALRCRASTIRYELRQMGNADLSETAFSDVCRSIIPYANHDESVFLQELIKLSDGRKIETPRTDCSLFSNDAEAEPSLIWERSRIALLLRDDEEDFLEQFGETYNSSSN